MKMPTCIVCHNPFQPQRFLQRVCSIPCSKVWAKQKESEAKERNESKRPSKPIAQSKPTKSHADHLNELQIVFNRFIRERDKGEDCISCGCEWDKSFHCGHYYSVGAWPNIRFNESNAHGQCPKCNIDLNGNWKGYTRFLGYRIGTEKEAELYILRNQPLKLSIPEILELKEKYKLKIKELRKQ